MGNLLRLLAREEGTCFAQQKYDLFLDFENAQPTETEGTVYREVQAVLLRAHEVTCEVSQYRGASKEIREAISNPADEFQIKVKEALCPLILQLRKFYQFSVDIGAVIPKILLQLCSGSLTSTQHLEQQQALVKQFAEILEFVLKFDELKMTTPALQNDLSYYRRMISRTNVAFSIGDNQEILKMFKDGDQVSSELASMMSLFYAEPTPMLKVLSDSTKQFLSDYKDISIESTTETFSTMARVCQRMLNEPDLIARFQQEETHLFVLRVMVGLIILFDHVHPIGAFEKNSKLDVKGCIRILKEQPATKSESLLNALRYTTRHLNDDSTPKQIKALLAS